MEKLETGELASRIGVPMRAIKAFCDRWEVGELALFGSVLRDDFRPGSDVDVLTRFRSKRTPGLAGIARMEGGPDLSPAGLIW